MHEIELIEGELNVRGTDWIKADRAGIRYIRPDGYAGAPTAELVTTALGWVGSSWLVQPRREIWLPRETSLEWAVYHLETAEGLGQDAPAWLPLALPRCEANGWMELIPFSPPGHPHRWATKVNGHCLMFIEVSGCAGALRFLAVIDGVVLTGREGEPHLFDHLDEAAYEAEMEVT